MPRRRAHRPLSLVVLNSEPALRPHELTQHQRWAILGAPSIVIAGLLAVSLRELARALPLWWTAWSLIAFTFGLMLAAGFLFRPVFSGDLERYEESRTWMLAVGGLYGSAVVLALGLHRAMVLRIDAPLGPLSPAAQTVLLWVALATGSVCAGAIATGVASVAMVVRTWVDEQRRRLWRVDARAIAARAARASADRLLWLLRNRPSALVQQETVHLLQMTHRVARVGIVHSAEKGSPGAPRELLLTVAACIQAGLVEMENSVYGRSQLRSTAVRLRQLADALEGGYWSDAARVLGDEAWGTAELGRARARQATYDVIALCFLLGLMWLTYLHVQLPWTGAPSMTSIRWPLGALTLVHLLATVRRQGWVSTGGYETFSVLLGALLRIAGISIPGAPHVDRTLPPCLARRHDRSNRNTPGAGK